MSKHHKPLVESPLFQTPLSKFINPKHKLVLLAEKIDWNSLEVNVAGTMSTGVGRPMMKPRLMSGIFLLKHLYNLSDENVLRQFIENPYMQYFCGLTYFTHDFPCDSTTIVKWRKKLGPDFFEKVLEETVKLALRAKVLKPSDLKKIYVDTTVQEKNIQFPTDTRLYLKGIKVLNRIAGKAGVKPKQSYKFTGPKLALKYSRYAHAKQMKRAKKCGKSLKTCFGRLLRDLDRKFKSHDLVTDKVKKVFEICFRIFNQKKSDKNKIYSVHAPEVKCISKGKAHKKYEFGNKVSVATTVKKNFVVGALSFNSNLFDGKTLKESLEQASNIMGKNPEYAYVGRGYRGYTKDCGETTVFHQEQRRGIDEPTKKLLKKRSRIEPVIGHLKLDHRLGRNFLLGEDGDKINLLLLAAAFNLRKLLSVFVFFIGWIKYRQFCRQRATAATY